MNDKRPILALTIGDPAGIGPEIVAKGLREQAITDKLRPLVIGDGGVMESVVRGCGLDLKIRRVEGPADVTGEPGMLELLDLENVSGHRFGAVDGAMGRAAIEYIERACALAREGAVQGIV